MKLHPYGTHIASEKVVMGPRQVAPTYSITGQGYMALKDTYVE